MSQQQKLARRLLVLALPRSSPRLCILQHESQWLQSRAVLTHYYSTSVPSTPPAASLVTGTGSTKKATKSSLPPVLQRPKPDTRRKADRPETSDSSRSRNKAKSHLSSPDATKFATAAAKSNATGAPTRQPANPSSRKKRWEKAEDETIIRLFQEERRSWKDIDIALHRPFSSCYERYYSTLDPNLRLWKLPNGPPDMDMIKRLVYLVDVEGLHFSKIDKYLLMNKPWEQPTVLAPPKMLLEAGIDPAAAEAARISLIERIRETPKHLLPPHINKVSLLKKYQDYKSLLSTNAIRLNKGILERAIRRSVELYGENWKKVAVNADILLDQWTPTRAVLSHTDTAETGPKAIPTSEAMAPSKSDDSHVDERAPLTPFKVSSIYRLMQRQGVGWGLEDDAVMARKILKLMETNPDVLDILALPIMDTPLSEGLPEDQNQRRQQYWAAISVALGNHSPVQCKHRWDGLLGLQDAEKSAQSKSWHRFERFHFWMLWTHYFRQRIGQQTLASRNVNSTVNGKVQGVIDNVTSDNVHTLYDLSTPEGQESALKEVSFTSEISGWMRHRNKAQCDKYFRSSVHSVLLRLGLIPSPSSAFSDESVTARAVPLWNVVSAEVADPLLAKMTTVSSENEFSTLGDKHQNIVRSDWTKERIQALKEIVMQEKQGVVQADFELNWERIAKQLADMFGAASDTSATATTAPVSTTVMDSQSGNQHMYFSPRQCESCWTYMSTSPVTLPSVGLSQSSSASSVSPTSTLSSGTAQADDVATTAAGLQNWSDHELQLLHQGVRKHGTSWADIRAQFLPNKDLSDLYQTWLSISTPASKDWAGGVSQAEEKRVRRGVMSVDRLSEPDYVGLMSALTKVSRSVEKTELGDNIEKK